MRIYTYIFICSPSCRGSVRRRALCGRGVQSQGCRQRCSAADAASLLLPWPGSRAARDVSLPCRIGALGLRAGSRQTGHWHSPRGAESRARCRVMGQGQTHICASPAARRGQGIAPRGLWGLGWGVLLNGAFPEQQRGRPTVTVGLNDLGCITSPVPRAPPAHRPPKATLLPTKTLQAKSTQVRQRRRAPRGCPRAPADTGSVRPRRCASEE